MFDSPLAYDAEHMLLLLRHMQKSHHLCSELFPGILLSTPKACSMTCLHCTKISCYGVAWRRHQICQLTRRWSFRLGHQQTNVLSQARQCIVDFRQLRLGGVPRTRTDRTGRKRCWAARCCHRRCCSRHATRVASSHRQRVVHKASGKGCGWTKWPLAVGPESLGRSLDVDSLNVLVS
jgi:hypothetical protein